MKAVLNLLILVCFYLPALSQSDTIIAFVKDDTGLMDGPDIPKAHEIITIPKGAMIKVTGVKAGSLKCWYSERFGYISKTSLEPNAAIEKLMKQAASSQPSSPPVYNTAPRSNSSGGCPAVQCSAYTQKGTRCKNRTTNCSGRCHVHN